MFGLLAEKGEPVLGEVQSLYFKNLGNATIIGQEVVARRVIKIDRKLKVEGNARSVIGFGKL